MLDFGLHLSYLVRAFLLSKGPMTDHNLTISVQVLRCQHIQAFGYGPVFSSLQSDVNLQDLCAVREATPR